MIEEEGPYARDAGSDANPDADSAADPDADRDSDLDSDAALEALRLTRPSDPKPNTAPKPKPVPKPKSGSVAASRTEGSHMDVCCLAWFA